MIRFCACPLKTALGSEWLQRTEDIPTEAGLASHKALYPSDLCELFDTLLNLRNRVIKLLIIVNHNGIHNSLTLI